MPKMNDADIEHPLQNWWYQGYVTELDPDQKSQLANRFGAENKEIGVVAINALANVTMYNHAYRHTKENENLYHLGLHLPVRQISNDVPPNPKQLKQITYEQLAGHQDRIGQFISWFSSVSHDAFVDTENMPKKDPRHFERISLELGGKRQFGDWEVTGPLDDMIRDVPAQMLVAEPEAKILVYGACKGDAIEDKRIRYVRDAAKSYTLYPHFKNSTHEFDTAMLRRRRPVADIYIEGKSDIILFKESLGVLIVDLIEPDNGVDLRKILRADYSRSLDLARDNASKRLKLQDTDAARIGGFVFERAITSPQGSTRDILAASAHYVQGVGEQYARLRTTATSN